MTIYSILDIMEKQTSNARFPLRHDQILNFGDIIVRRNSKFMIVIKDMKEEDKVMVAEKYGNVYVRERKNIWFSTTLNTLMHEF